MIETRNIDIKKDLLIHNQGVYLSGNETNEDYLNL